MNADLAKRPLRQISLRRLFALVTIICVVGAIGRRWTNVINTRSVAVAKVKELGGAVAYRKLSNEAAAYNESRLQHAIWWGGVDGVFLNQECYRIDFGPQREFDETFSVVTDDDVQLLSSLVDIRCLDVSGSRVTDSGLASIAQLHNLEELNLAGTQITGEGIVHLRKLKHLRAVDLSDTGITDAAIFHLKDCRTLERISLRLSMQATHYGNWKRSISSDAMTSLATLPQLRSIDIRGRDLPAFTLSKAKP